MFEKYTGYFRDNPQNLWFKRKLYGWGWTPVRWQGWAVVFGYTLVVFGIVFLFGQQEYLSTLAIFFKIILPILISTILLFWICYKKGERPRWQWGLPKDKINPHNPNV
jgi:energy-coupling factor transporter transmembrane protein EcfT